MAGTRDQIIETTCDLMENQGYHATGLNEIVKESGSPKGSLYYYFPGGKEEIAAEAVAWAGRKTAARVREALLEKETAGEAIQDLLYRIAFIIEESGYRAGGPLTAVAMETATTSERLNLACRQAYQEIRAAFAEKLQGSGIPSERAVHLAAFITASVEGGILLSRTDHSGAPLRLVADQVRTLVEGESKN
jgi:TetR/AcrR family transcriptional regulator, lmrAB and yxaGH operons repressor